MRLKVLGSSSAGNAYLLETDTGTLLLDAGVPFREIQAGLEFDLAKVEGCLITHIHGDHALAIRGVCRSGIDVHAPGECLSLLDDGYSHRFHPTEPGEQFSLGDFTILAVEAQHDADVSCLAFLVIYRPTGEKLLYATDTYYLKNKFKELNYILIECNYCRDILDSNFEKGLIDKGRRGRLLKSHFSLENVKVFLQANEMWSVEKIVLIHLSDSNSNAAQMISEIHELTKKDTVIAEAGKVIELEMCPF